MIQIGRRLWRHITRRRRFQLGLLVVFMFAASLAELFSIGAVVPLLVVLASPADALRHPLMADAARALGITTPEGLVLPVTIAFCAGAILSGALRYGLLTAQTRLTYSIGSDLSVLIFERTLHQPYLVHVSRNSSEIIAGVSAKANDLIVALLYPVTVIFASAITLGTVMAGLLVVEPVLTLSTLAAFSVFYGVVSALSRRRLDRSGRIIAEHYATVIRVVQEALGGIRDVILDGAQAFFARNYSSSERALRNARATVQIMSGTPRFIIETLGTLFLAVLAYRLAVRGDGLTGAIPVLGAVALTAQRLLPVAQQMYASWAGVKGGRASVADALDLLEQTVPPEAYLRTIAALPFTSAIELRGVSFRYAPGLPDVLTDVNLRIPKGSRIGIIGQTGAGKSTLLDLLMGLLTPTQGEILVDGVPLTPVRLREWQRTVAHVPQAIYLADASVTDNIAFGHPAETINPDRVRAAARTAQVHDVIESLPDGYATMIGERGIRLSGGQRQRLGIARALYKDARVLVLDEATSALDSRTEAEVMAAIHDLPEQITMLLVAHRHSTLEHCSSVVRVGRGTVEVTTEVRSAT